MRNRRQNFILILILGILDTVTPFSIDMYLPSFSAIAQDLHSTVARVSFSVSVYFIGFSIGQIAYGPLLDRFGRKRPIYLGLFIFILGSLGCMQAHSISMLLACRFIQALGGCAASVGAMAMVQDYFAPEERAKVFSLLILVLSASPLLAPSVGSIVVTWWNWRVVFAILASIAALNIAMVRWLLPHGHAPPDPNVSLEPKAVFASFKVVMQNPDFYTYAISGSFSFAGLFVFVAGAPSIFMETFHVSAGQFGAIFAILVAGMIGGGQLNLLLLKRYSPEQIFKATLILQVIVSMVFFAGCVGELFGLASTMVLLFIVLSCAGITGPNSNSLALAPFSRIAGVASSLLGFVQLALGSIISACVGFLDVKGTLPTAAVMSLSSAIALAALLLLHQRVRRPA